ncbi:transcriptional activator domain-containing protein [Gemmatirosa kalamazoonensis]|uniref:Transcriptional activator domain-containing protein n=1 Tax=Gemmatirosa kalamazoonensis TaxID=861299 RepID=W0RDR7_9BACT|nr:BTAD domain-containing putative transcriptional regulator [Gemmatirosa kalamazoonensis]AHG89219.1 transcriptional activator domain-containing protein [Gemmatirosa kalamazoonensis]
MVRIQLLGGAAVHVDGRPATGAAAQPRRLALLAVIACAGDAGIRRERLVALFWPDADEEHGRAALKQALYALRRDLGDESILVGQQVLRLDAERVTSDVAELRAALAAGRPERAAELYSGPLLDGFRVPGVPEFERWLDDERRALARVHAEALDRLAAEATQRGDAAGAVRWWRALAAQDPLSARAALGLMESLAAAGDVGAALRHARVHATLLAQELDLPPDPRVLALETRLRASAAEPRRDLPVPETVAVPNGSAPTAPRVALVAPGFAGHRRWRTIAAVGVALLGTIAAGTRVLLHSAGSAPPVLAVGRVTAFRGDSATTATAAPLADMLATNLARAPGLRVISPARMYALLDGGATSPAALSDAARRAGATELVEGTLTASTGGTLRLDLRRVDLASGRIVAAGSVTGHDPFALVDSGTARIVGAYGRAASIGSVADATTRSVVAYRLYAEGVKRGYHDGDLPGAAHLLAAAVREDSTFAMAAWYAALLSRDPPAQRAALIARANRLAEHASERERLVIRASWARWTASPTLYAFAESLLTRYPDEVEGHFFMGLALRTRDEYAAALPHLERAVAMDSAHVGDTEHPGCVACEAILEIANTHLVMDSLDAAERAVRRWIRLDPRSARAWRHLSLILDAEGQSEGALEARRTGATLDPPSAMEEADFLADHWLRLRQYTRADALLEQELQAGNGQQVASALWWLAISQRQQGRVADALRTARRLRATAPVPNAGVPGEALLEAQLLLDAGRYRESAALFDSVGHVAGPAGAASEYARNRAWMLAHAADALAEAGDTAGLARLVDSVAAWGRQSLLGRDQRMHHHVRGLLLAARGDDAGAVAELRAAMRSPNLGYSRTNYALARALLRLGRPLDAVRALRPLFHGPVDNSNVYVSRTEVHALLARAWSAAGNADSAAAHRRIVTEDWAHADADYVRRVEGGRDNTAGRLTAGRSTAGR